MRKVFKTVSVTLAIMAVSYGMFLKYVDKTPEITLEPVVLPSVISIADTTAVTQDYEIEMAMEEPY